MRVRFLQNMQFEGRSFNAGTEYNIFGDALYWAIENNLATPVQQQGGWDDLKFPVAGINPPGATADPDRNTANGLLEFDPAATNTVAIQAQMPHAWKEGSIIKPHVHWRKKTEGAGNVVWQLEYEFAGVGSAFADSFNTATVSSPISATPDDGSALVHLISSFGEINMSGHKLSTMGVLKLSRLGGDGGDTYAGVAQLLEFDIHFESDQPQGSGEEFTK